ncbi:MAG TPA: hypothetical protein DEO38_03835 [Bacteroidales bacterium]|nr:hypothetical protein [Bacteroidales bacterium]
MQKITKLIIFMLFSTVMVLNFSSCKDNDSDDLVLPEEDNTDRNYIESPYSLNSVKDFADNIRGIVNVYQGVSGSANVSDYVRAVNADLDSRVRAALSNAITKIEAIPEPFVTSAPSSVTQQAIDATNELEALLSGEVMELLGKDYQNKNALLSAAMEPYVNKIVIPTYHEMTLHATELSDLCATILEKYDEGTLTQADIKAADDAWLAARQAWELSEAFLLGPASDHKVDPHIDSWPLAKSKLLNMLNNKAQMAQIEADGGDYVGNYLGYGLLGFHAVEFMIFQLSSDGTQSMPHSVVYNSRAELVYLAAVAEDLRNQSIFLEACWAGIDAMTPEQQQILEDAELESVSFADGYGFNFIHAGEGGSRFKNMQAAAEEIIDGCASIADEVANTKMGTPHGAKD